MLLSVLLYVGVQTLIGANTFGLRGYGRDWGLSFVAAVLDTTIAIWFVVVGASIGSFLNVVAYRLPLGRYIGGHSGCPYCKTPIDGLDNVPVLAWVKLRGRCRTCRLPISIQYPLVEFSVAVLFFIVYLTEFSTGAANLPGEAIGPRSSGFLRVNVTPVLMMRLISYLFALSGLVAAALIAVKRKPVPLSLFAWCLAPWLVCALLEPAVIITPWRAVPPAGDIEARLDSFTSILCGMVTGLALARLLAPVLYAGFDHRLLGSDHSSRGARQFMGAMFVAGGLVGWQSTVLLGWVTVLCGCLAAIVLRRFRKVAEFADLTVWVWLGLLVFRGNWAGWRNLASRAAEVGISGWQVSDVPAVLQQVAAALLLAPACVLFRQLASVPAKIDDDGPPGERFHKPMDDADLAEQHVQYISGNTAGAHSEQNSDAVIDHRDTAHSVGANDRDMPSEERD